MAPPDPPPAREDFEFMVTPEEIARRYHNVREAMLAEKVDGLIVCGNQYSGFEGAVRYMSGFEIVHRYAYVLFSLEGDPVLVFPREARWIGDKKKPWVREHVWADVPGKWLRESAEKRKWKRVAVYGLDYIMPVRDYRELQQAPFELVPFDFAFDMARAVKSEIELAAVRDSMGIILEGFQLLLESYEPGKTEAEIMAPAVECFFARGAGPRMMNILLGGPHGEAEAHFKVPALRPVAPDDLLLYSLEITGADGYWVEFSRPLIRGRISPRTLAMSEIYPQAMEAARALMREGEPACNVHRAAAEIFERRGFRLGHLTGHSIGMTMIEHPAIGANSNVELQQNMIFSFHPQVVDQDGQVCLYTQDTYRIGKTEGECLANVPWRFYAGPQ
ncbi:MAG TPA: M24 family metallopeptidase [Candidatus Limnocylindrales bacterium]|nr:M24 family metallopeptidase [Candidatus Limnocylindrales bacterium]